MSSIAYFSAVLRASVSKTPVIREIALSKWYWTLSCVRLLGEIDDPPYFDKSYVFPRDYAWVTDANLDSTQHVIQTALEIAFADDLSPDEVKAKVESLVDRAQESGLDIDEQAVWDVIDDRADEDEEPATYSWVHLNKFRKFELHERCFPWTTEDELRTEVDELPSPTPRPEWEERKNQ